MTFDLNNLLSQLRGQGPELHSRHINPRFAKAMKIIGFDRHMVRGEGQYLWDLDGRRYLDMLGGYAVFNAGRNHPAIRAILHEYLDSNDASLVQMDTPVLSGALAAELKERIGRDLDRVFFCNSGTEGMEAAIKFARAATNRSGIVHADRAYHGLTLGALSANGCASFRDGFGTLLQPTRSVPFGNLAALQEALAPRDIAALILEPIQGKGVFLPPPGYLAEAGRLARAHGTLLVLDEVQTGMGRTGSFLAIDQEDGVEPDIVVVSKALSGGFVPVAAVLLRGDTWSATFSSLDRAVVHSSTFAQGGMAMAAGLAYLSVLDEENLCQRAQETGAALRAGLESMQPRFEMLGEIRQRGLMVGIEFKKPTSLSLRTGWAAIHAMDSNLFPQAITMPLLDEHSILTQVAGHELDVVKLTPPLVINDEDVDDFLSAFQQVLASLHRFPGPAWKVLTKLGKHALSKGSTHAKTIEHSSTEHS